MSIPESIINLINDVELIMADMIRKIKWKDGVYCPHCKSRNIIKWGRYKLFQRYKCKDCKRCSEPHFLDTSLIGVYT